MKTNLLDFLSAVGMSDYFLFIYLFTVGTALMAAELPSL